MSNESDRPTPIPPIGLPRERRKSIPSDLPPDQMVLELAKAWAEESRDKDLLIEQMNTTHQAMHEQLLRAVRKSRAPLSGGWRDAMLVFTFVMTGVMAVLHGCVYLGGCKWAGPAVNQPTCASTTIFW